MKQRKKLKTESRKQKGKQQSAGVGLSHIAKLHVLYADIPETKGCMDSINKPKEEGGCEGWCCRFQNPSVLFVEFINSWNYVLKNWEIDRIVNLVERSMLNYVSDNYTKTCVFWDEETKLCEQHESRPLNCRIYAITPEEEFKPRYERLKVLTKYDLTAIVRDQCNLVSTKDGSKVTTNDTNRWWLELKDIERSTGIPEEKIHDGDGGSYRTYHDHIMLYLVPKDMLHHLSVARVQGTRSEQLVAVQQVMKVIRKNIEEKVEQIRQPAINVQE